MTRPRWLAAALGAVLTAIVAAPASAAADNEPRALGKGPAYETLAKLPVLHEGRIKPLDTLAREEVRQIYGRETVKVIDPADAKEPNRVVETWTPVSALFDWSVRPEFWDDQAIILVEYMPLKRLILSETIKARLDGTAGKETTSAADREGLKALAADKEISAEAIRGFLAKSTLPQEDKAALGVLVATLAESHKWLTPKQLEEAKIIEGEGHEHPFDEWFREVVAKKRQADASMTGDVKLTEVEKRGYEVGTRLVHYQAIRDRSMRSVEPLMVMPRPTNAEYLAFLGKTYDKAQKTRSIDELSPFELDGAKALDTYWNELATEERSVPGKDE
ncbi:MAG: ABC transporter permease, partial [Isosphaeraceae bacterium]